MGKNSAAARACTKSITMSKAWPKRQETTSGLCTPGLQMVSTPFDPTWHPVDPGEIPQTKYIGIEMPLLKVMMFVKKTEYQGVIPNREKAPEILESILERLKQNG